MHDLHILLVQIFREAGPIGQPFSLRDITRILGATYCDPKDRAPNYHAVRRAFKNLHADPNTREDVEPLPRRGREQKFSAKAARRIARRAVRGEVPHKYKNTPSGSSTPSPSLSSPLPDSLTPKRPKFKKKSTKRKLSATKVQIRPVGTLRA
jgi:hypothetical protein